MHDCRQRSMSSSCVFVFFVPSWFLSSKTCVALTFRVPLNHLQVRRMP
jgi:hypothetical protein